MAIVDLSHRLNNATPVYPGTGAPRFEKAATLAQDGYRETRLSFDSHLGTHIDAPAHMLAEGKTLDLFTIEKFFGTALIIPVPDGHSFVDQAFFVPYADRIREVDFVLFHTGWSRYWGTPRYFEGFPTLTTDAMEWLTGFSLKGVGFDVISADPLLSSDYPNHLLLFHKEMIIIENLVFPTDWQITQGRLSCFPLAYEDADGSPVRAVLEVEEV